MNKCVYPGSFDPVTTGHLDIIERTAKLFDDVTVAVLNNYTKSPAFSVAERTAFIKKSVAHLKNVRVGSFDGLLVDYMKQQDAKIIIRGLRALSDFEHEFQLAAMNTKLCSEVETIFMMTNTKYSFLSSSMVREIVQFGGSVEGLVPAPIIDEIRNRLTKQ